MRGYEEPIEVGVREGRGPVSFQWRGRRYRVVQVLDTWRERVPWWRLALAPEPACAGATSEADGEGREGSHEVTTYAGRDAHERLHPLAERRVWRVEAAAGHLASSGVFQLVQHGERWTLHALAD